MSHSVKYFNKARNTFGTLKLKRTLFKELLNHKDQMDFPLALKVIIK